MLVNGRWTKEWEPVQAKDSHGRFIRQQSCFRDTVPAQAVAEWLQGDQQTPMYELYVAYICPWATRTLIARQLLGLESFIGLKVVQPELTDYGWAFGEYPSSTSKKEVAVDYIYELYTQSNPHYSGRATVPVLWDIAEQRIVNNESADLLRIFNDQLQPIHQSKINLYPARWRHQIDQFNQDIYATLNNGVYRAGLASSQFSYVEAVTEVFACLDTLEKHLTDKTFAVGDQLTESDIRLFVTLSRFDVAYYGLFKTNIKRLADYPQLSRYLENLLTIPAFKDNTKIDHIKAGYYSIKALNPSGIIPVGPSLPWGQRLTTNE